MGGISVRTWIVAATAGAASVLAHWHPWAPYRSCPSSYSSEVCLGQWPENTSAELTWWWAFTVVLPPLWGLVVRVRHWFVLWWVGAVGAVTLQAGLMLLLARVTWGSGVRTAIESAALAVFYGSVSLLTEVDLRRRPGRQALVVLGALVVVLPLLVVWLDPLPDPFRGGA